MKTGPDALGIAENEFGSAKMKTGTDALGTVEKRVWEHKTLKRDPTPTVPPKMSSEAQNVKTGSDSHGTAENESGSVKHENGT
jgi:hypothetical protein